MKAIGCEIFGGSQTIGHLQTGWDVKKILEMTDDMRYYNAYHFVKNYPDIPVIDFSEWHNEEYFSNEEEYDLLFANNPCSGLSSINRNASVDGAANVHFYEVLFAIEHVKPKSFLIENAPTLTRLGLPILKEIQAKIGDRYKLIIINDLAGNHGVAMHRRRTMIFGFSRKHFNNRVANLEPCKQEKFTVRDAFKGLTKDTPNMEFDTLVRNEEFTRFYNLVEPGNSIMRTLDEKLDTIEDQLTEKEYTLIKNFREKRQSKDSVWDKSSYRLSYDDWAPSMATVIQLMHPEEDRDLYIREYARLMGYPDDFILYPNECKCSVMQCLAQGVPVNFIKYASNEIMKAFNGNTLDLKGDVLYINQCSEKRHIVEFTSEEFQNCKDITKNEKELVEVELF